MIYCYYIARGLASLHKMTSNGDDVDQKPVKIGKFKNNDDARNACYRDWETDRKSTRLNSSHSAKSRMPSSA